MYQHHTRRRTTIGDAKKGSLRDHTSLHVKIKQKVERSEGVIRIMKKNYRARLGHVYICDIMRHYHRNQEVCVGQHGLPPLFSSTTQVLGVAAAPSPFDHSLPSNTPCALLSSGRPHEAGLSDIRAELAPRRPSRSEAQLYFSRCDLLRVCRTVRS